MSDSWPPSHTLRLARLAFPNHRDDFESFETNPTLARCAKRRLCWFDADDNGHLAICEAALIGLGFGDLLHAHLVGVMPPGTFAAFARADQRRRALIAVLDAHPEIEKQ